MSDTLFWLLIAGAGISGAAYWWVVNNTPEAKKNRDLQLLEQAITLLQMSSFSHPAISPERQQHRRQKAHDNLRYLADKYGVELHEWKPFMTAAKEIQKIIGEKTPDEN